MQENGSLEPEFEFDEDHTFFMVKLPVHSEMIISAMEDTMEVRSLILQLKKSLSRKDLLQTLHLKNDENLRKRYINPAISLGLIEMTIPDKPNSRYQKYRLTDKGYTLLNRLESGVESGVESESLSDLRFQIWEKRLVKRGKMV